jgi:cyanophycin synthetase
VEALFSSQHYDLKSDLIILRKMAAEDKLGPSTSTIVEAAKSRNIPVIRLDSGSLVQLGHGCEQKRIEATITDNTSNIAVDLASDKNKTKTILKEAGITVPEGFLISTSEELDRTIEEMGFPLVIKPNNSNQGKGVTIGIKNKAQACRGFEKAKVYGEEVLVERVIPGNDYRLLVINYKFVAAAKRTPAMVTGDGILKIRELIDMVNLDPSRGDDHENTLTKIRIDASTEEILKYQDFSMDYVPPVGKNIYLKHTANLSTGGTSEDVTDLIHPEVVSLAERVARIIGLDICGIDFISEDIGLPLKSGKGVIIEVNAAPGFRMHTHPVKGKPRNVGKAVIDMMFPGKAGRIPLIAVTGTNGKTTTTRLIAHIARAAGYHAGFTTSDGIYIGNELIQEGDCTGYFSAQKVLRDKSVNFAVLECARGGLLRSGLAFDQCDVGIVTNVAEDHLGLNGINTLEEMARVKSVIPETVKSSGVAVLNADDPLTCAMKDHLKCRVALFSTQLSSCVLDHCRKGGIAAIYKDRRILLVKGNTIFLNESIYSIPLSFGGKALFMIENILAAVLGAYFTGIDLEIISKALHSFVPSFDNLPGRMNLYRIKDFRFLLDYAHNFHGITALGTLLKKENLNSSIH